MPDADRPAGRARPGRNPAAVKKLVGASAGVRCASFEVPYLPGYVACLNQNRRAAAGVIAHRMREGSDRDVFVKGGSPTKSAVSLI